jgi:plasmid stabilization system protein ParE
MAQIRWTEEARRWLHDIHDYIASDNPDAAQRLVVSLYQKAQILHRFPEIGHAYRSEPDGEIRILLYGHYRIATCSKPTKPSTFSAFFMAHSISTGIFPTHRAFRPKPSLSLPTPSSTLSVYPVESC